MNTLGEKGENMQVKVGTDIIEVARIENSIEELGDKFINKVFTEKEIEYCKDTKALKYQHYAARFAAKEATFKAVSDLLNDKYSVSWKNIQVINNQQGKPEIEFVSLDKEVEKELKKIISIDVSLSHIKEFAVANVCLICN